MKLFLTKYSKEKVKYEGKTPVHQPYCFLISGYIFLVRIVLNWVTEIPSKQTNWISCFTPLQIYSCFSYFGFEIRWIHLISWIRKVLYGYWNLLSMNNNLFTHNAFNYPWIMQIHFAVSMHNAVSHFSYPGIVNCSMDNANEHFTYLWIINSIIHVQSDELV